MRKEIGAGERIYKAFIYLVLGVLAVLILVPVLWVVMASVKETSEHYGSPWALPTHIHWQNFVGAWTKANMGGYMLHSVTVTGLALALVVTIKLSIANINQSAYIRTTSEDGTESRPLDFMLTQIDPFTA